VLCHTVPYLAQSASLNVVAYSFNTKSWGKTSPGESLLHIGYRECVRINCATCSNFGRFTYWCIDKLEYILSHWKISKENVHLVLRDNASNMDCAVKDADIVSFGCFAHSLQL